MGLKTNNYVSKNTGIVLPEAYAILKNLIIEKDDSVRAIFSIQANRENAKTFKPLDAHEIRFKWDRVTNPVKMAYEKAKTETFETEKFNENKELVKVVENGLLYGWQDSIL